MAPSRTAMLASFAGACLATGCSGGGPSNPVQPIFPSVPTATPTPATPTPTPATPTPTPTATPVAAGSVSLNPSTIAFITTGRAAAQSTTASETGYNGPFTVTATTCDGIASISHTSGTSAFTVTPQSNGNCTITISGAPGESGTLSVSVTLTSGSIQTHGRRAGQ